MYKPNVISILCPGNWNKKLFNGQWVANNIFNLEKDEQLSGFITPDMNIGFVYKGLILIINENHLNIKVDKIDNDNNVYAIKVLNTILDLLPHTPISGIGINIHFECKNKIEYFKLLKANIKDLNNFKPNQIILSKKEEQFEVNVIFDLKSEKLKPQFNFHHKSLKKFKESKINELVEYAQKTINEWEQ